MQPKNIIHLQTNIIVYTTIALIISFIPLHIASFYLTLGFVPLVILGLKFGLKPCLEASFLWGILTLLTGQAQILSLSQAFLEYIIAFTCGGLSGLYNLKKHSLSPKTIFLSLSIGLFCRYFWHFIAGILFWRIYMPPHFNPYLYSLLANGSSALLSLLVDYFILIFIYKIHPKIFY